MAQNLKKAGVLWSDWNVLAFQARRSSATRSSTSYLTVVQSLSTTHLWPLSSPPNIAWIPGSRLSFTFQALDVVSPALVGRNTMNSSGPEDSFTGAPTPSNPTMTVLCTPVLTRSTDTHMTVHGATGVFNANKHKPSRRLRQSRALFIRRRMLPPLSWSLSLKTFRNAECMAFSTSHRTRTSDDGLSPSNTLGESAWDADRVVFSRLRAVWRAHDFCVDILASSCPLSGLWDETVGVARRPVTPRVLRRAEEERKKKNKNKTDDNDDISLSRNIRHHCDVCGCQRTIDVSFSKHQAILQRP